MQQRSLAWLAVAAFVAAFGSAAAERSQARSELAEAGARQQLAQIPPAQPPGTEAAGCPDPTFAGKYSGELRRLNVPADLATYGACHDYGAWSGDSYAGESNLPKGYWVYSVPYWIIYANRTAPKE